MSAIEASKASSSRLEYLDGLRGLAALCVVMDHFSATFLPLAPPGPAFTSWVLNYPFALIIQNARFSVSIFFVLSGFVLSNSAAKTKGTLPARLVARYLRLTVPMTASLILAWFAYNQFSTWRLALQALSPDGWLTQHFYGTHVPGLPEAIKDGLYRVYLTGASLFNNVVWTMRRELLGSVAIYVIYRFCRENYLWAALAVFLAVSVPTASYLCFPIGALLREAWVRGWLRGTKGAWAACLAGLSCSPLVTAFNLSSTFLAIFDSIGAGLLVFSILSLPLLQWFLLTKLLQFLGRVSFALYLVHVPVIISLTAWLYFHLQISFYFKFTIMFFSTVLMSAFVAWLMTLWLDEPMMKSLHKLRKIWP
jgi:peptidoglycan/LPS O-acetylase OafA/YrhL